MKKKDTDGALTPSFKQSYKVEKKSMVSLSVYNVGQQKCLPGYTWGPGVRDHYLIHYITGGRGTYTTGGRTYELSAGDIFLALPDTEIMYRASDDDPWTYEWVGFYGTDAPSIIERTALRPDCPVLHSVSYGEELREHLLRIIRAFGNTFQSAVEMTGELYLLLFVLVSRSGVPEPERSGAAEDVRRAVEYIASHYSYGITVEDIAAYIGVSRSTLFREFRKKGYPSPKEYLDRFRIDRARVLLTDTQLPVGAVATSVGYDNGPYFSKAFRKFTQMTPSLFRKKHAL
uniref:helix-turn-helix transcriptional regulator n=1 Tax=Eubacterium cellulosolvens TaxID=29322 RepID=UPI000AE75B82|nr:AraC family transcriptional regulator [[Eubacterium] cellulosolvens]